MLGDLDPRQEDKDMMMLGSGVREHSFSTSAHGPECWDSGMSVILVDSESTRFSQQVQGLGLHYWQPELPLRISQQRSSGL